MAFTAANIPENEIELNAIRASGPGGQNVNKVSTAIHLRLDIKASSIPEAIKQRLLSMRDRRISADGVIVIKAQQSRSQESNREDAIRRLDELLAKAQVRQKARKKTAPSRSAKRKRMDSKTKRGKDKALRKKPDY